jgi:hypothetical protein
MAISKKFTDLVAKVCGSNVGELLRQIGEQATKHAYSGNDASYAQYALDTLPDAWRNPLATWFRARGLIVSQKAVGSSRFVVGETDDAGAFKCVKTARKRDKAFDEAACVPVLHTQSQSVRGEPKVKELKGSVQTRAENAAARAIKALKKVDPEAAAVLNDKLAQPAAVEVHNAIVVEDTITTLSASEAEALSAYLLQLRMEARKAA